MKTPLHYVPKDSAVKEHFCSKCRVNLHEEGGSYTAELEVWQNPPDGYTRCTRNPKISLPIDH